MMPRYIFLTDEGVTIAPNDDTVENCQVLGIISGDSADDAEKNLLKANPWIKSCGFTSWWSERLGEDIKLAKERSASKKIVSSSLQKQGQELSGTFIGIDTMGPDWITIIKCSNGSYYAFTDESREDGHFDAYACEKNGELLDKKPHEPDAVVFEVEPGKNYRILPDRHEIKHDLKLRKSGSHGLGVERGRE